MNTYTCLFPLSWGRRWQNLQTPAVDNVGSSTRCSCRGIQHFGQHLDQLSARWNSNAVLLQTGLKAFVVGNMTTFLPRCRGGGFEEGTEIGSLARWCSRQRTCQVQRCVLIFVRAECLLRRACSLHVTKWMELSTSRLCVRWFKSAERDWWQSVYIRTSSVAVGRKRNLFFKIYFCNEWHKDCSESQAIRGFQHTSFMEFCIPWGS